MSTDSRLNRSASGTADAAGAVRVSFPPPDGGWVWEGSLYPVGAPSTALWTVAVGGVNWGSYGSSITSQIAHVQSWASESVVIVGTGFTPNSVVTFQWTGVETPIQYASHVGPSAMSSSSTAAAASAYATISFVSGAAGSTPFQAAAATVTVAIPAGVAAGDLLLVHLGVQTGASGYTFTIGGVPKTFTQLRDDVTSGSGVNARGTLLWRIADGTEGGLNLVVTIGGGALSACMSILIYRGVNQATPVSGSTGVVSSGNVTFQTTGAITTLLPNQWILSLFTRGDGAGATTVIGTPIGVTNRLSNYVNGYLGLSDNDELLPVAAASTPRTATEASAVAFVGQALALVPAPV